MWAKKGGAIGRRLGLAPAWAGRTRKKEPPHQVVQHPHPPVQVQSILLGPPRSTGVRVCHLFRVLPLHLPLCLPLPLHLPLHLILTVPLNLALIVSLILPLHLPLPPPLPLHLPLILSIRD